MNQLTNERMNQTEYKVDNEKLEREPSNRKWTNERNGMERNERTIRPTNQQTRQPTQMWTNERTKRTTERCVSIFNF